MLTRKIRILIVAYDWPPRNAIAVHRPYAWARYWTGAGAEVSILTAQKQTYDEPLDLQLDALDGVHVVEIPYRSLIPLGGGPARTNWSRRFVGFLRKHGSMLRKFTGLNPDVRDAWARAAVPVALDLCITKQIDVVISTFAPRAAHMIASKIKEKNPEIMWIADYRDLWSIRHNSDLNELQSRKEQTLEKRVVSSADMFITVSEPLAQNLSKFMGCEVHVSKNGFDLDRAKLDTRLSQVEGIQSSKPSIIIVYTGMIYPGWQDPTPLFHAVNELVADQLISNEAVQIHFYGKRQPTLQALIDSADAAGYTTVHGHVSREEALQAQLNADLLLLLESGHPSADGVLTGKIFEYMVSGKPILSLGSRKKSTIGLTIAETGIGVTCESNIHDIKNVILTALSGGVSEIYHPRKNEIEKYSRKHQAEELIGVIERQVVLRQNSQ